jgi:hypothetical protein
MVSSMGLELAFHISDLKRILTAEDRHARKEDHPERRRDLRWYRQSTILAAIRLRIIGCPPVAL